MPVPARAYRNVAGNTRAAFAAAPQQAPQPDNLDQLQLDHLALRGELLWAVDWAEGTAQKANNELEGKCRWPSSSRSPRHG